MGTTIDDSPTDPVDSAAHDSGIRWPDGIPPGLAKQVPPVPAGVGVIIRDVGGRMIGANRTAAHLLRLSWAELLNTTLGDARWQPLDENGLPIAPEQRPSLGIWAARPVESRLLGLSLPRLSDSPDSLAWLSVTTTLAADAAGEPIATILLFGDETDSPRGRAATDRVVASYRDLAGNVTDFVLRTTLQGRIAWVSPSVTAATGWPMAALIGRGPGGFEHPDDTAKSTALLGDLVLGKRTQGRCRLLSADGDYRWFFLSSAPIFAPDGTVTGGVHGFTSVGALVEAEESVEAERALLRASLDNLADPYVVVSVARNDSGLIVDFTVTEANPAACEFLTLPRERLLGGSLFGPWPVAIAEQLASLCTDVVSTGLARQLVGLHSAGSGQDRWYDVRISPIGGGASVHLRDVTGQHLARRALEESREKLRFQAFTDELTGMRNRAWILNALEQDLADAGRRGGTVGVLFIDLDNFKLINDSLGHVAGDEVLAEVAERMMAGLRADNRVGRFGGDEFVVVVPDVADPAEVERVAETIAAALGTELTIHGHRIVPTVSIGIALSTPESTAASLLRDTDSALFSAKKSGRARWQFFDATMHAQAMCRLTLEEDIRTSLDSGDFVVHYQPVVRLSDRKVVGHEALVRWQHPRRGLISPAEFLPVAEESGLIVGIGRAVLDGACTVLAAQPDAPGTISVNVSAVELCRDDWAARFIATLTRHRVDPTRLVVEVTETAVLALGVNTLDNLTAVRDLGVGLHVDDFGTGFSSISLLRDLPVTGLKLDASFVAGLGDPISVDGRGAHALAAGLSGLVSHLRLTGVAEGVETEAQAAALRRHGWQLGQGYLFGRPAPWPG